VNRRTAYREAQRLPTSSRRRRRFLLLRPSAHAPPAWSRLLLAPRRRRRVERHSQHAASSSRHLQTALPRRHLIPLSPGGSYGSFARLQGGRERECRKSPAVAAEGSPLFMHSLDRKMSTALRGGEGRRTSTVVGNGVRTRRCHHVWGPGLRS